MWHIVIKPEYPREKNQVLKLVSELKVLRCYNFLPYVFRSEPWLDSEPLKLPTVSLLVG